MRIVITGGGTGGHVYPAIAIAEKLKEKVPDAKIVFIGTQSGLESSILQNFDYKTYYIEVSGFSRKLGKDIFRSAKNAFRGLKQSIGLLLKIKPDVVIGTGGYVCGPVVLAASMLGIKTCIQEQNALPGVTNRILGKFANRIFLGSEAAKKYFSRKDKVFVEGNPIRSDIMLAKRNNGYSRFGFDPQKQTLLVSGGSRGAMSINSAMRYVNEKFAGSSAVQVLHITGDAGYEETLCGMTEKVREAKNIKIVPYLDMPEALAIADLAVFRAGALALSELAARGVPAVLIPYPYATGNHQEHNARAFEKENAAIVVRDNELSGESMFSLINILLGDRERLSSMALSARLLGKPDAADKIADNIISLAGK